MRSSLRGFPPNRNLNPNPNVTLSGLQPKSHILSSGVDTRHRHACQAKRNKLVRLIALQYAARKCKQNKRYRTSARLDENTWPIFVSMQARDGRTDRQSATQYAAPSYGGGPHNNSVNAPQLATTVSTYKKAQILVYFIWSVTVKNNILYVTCS